MASLKTKKPCSMCPKGSAILTCDGCQKSFCATHIREHRQNLSVEMETIIQEYDLLQQDFIRKESSPHPLLSRIDLWEQNAIRKIQQNAKQLRDGLHSFVQRDREVLKDQCTSIGSELKTSQKVEDYTEIDLQSWTNKLSELRTMLGQQTGIDLIDDDKKPLVQSASLKIIHKPATANSHQNRSSFLDSLSASVTSNESILRLDPFVGNAIFSVNRLSAKHNGNPTQSIMVCLNRLFDSTTNDVRFSIEQKTNRFLFFGILNGNQNMDRTAFYSLSLYGWMSFDTPVIESRKVLSTNGQGLFQQGDELTMNLNCKTGNITLSRPSTHTTQNLQISLQQCPLPWRVVVAFFNRNDGVRLMDRR